MARGHNTGGDGGTPSLHNYDSNGQEITASLSSGEKEVAAARRRKRVVLLLAAAAAAALIVAFIVVVVHRADRSTGDAAGGSNTSSHQCVCRPLPSHQPLPNGTVLPATATVISSIFTAYPVESRQYPEAPGYLFVTQRGGGGLSVFRMGATDALERLPPTAVARWEVVVPPSPTPPTTTTAATGSGFASAASSFPVEGQDRVGDLMVVCSVGTGGGIFLLNASDPLRLVTIGSTSDVVAPDGSGPLHVKFYKPTSNPQRLFAIATMGWSSTWNATIPNPGSYLRAFDVTDPRAPKRVADLQTPAACLEGVFIVGDAAYIGGFCSDALVTVNLAGLLSSSTSSFPPHMAVMGVHRDPYYVQLVADSFTPPPCTCGFTLPDGRSPMAVLVVGLWTANGGIGVFNVSQPGQIDRLGWSLGADSGFANRVHMRPDGVALVPLEHFANESDHAGGFALFSIRDPRNPILLHAQRLPVATRVYCAAFSPSGNVVYVFGADDNSTRVYALPESLHYMEVV